MLPYQPLGLASEPTTLAQLFCRSSSLGGATVILAWETKPPGPAMVVEWAGVSWPCSKSWAFVEEELSPWLLRMGSAEDMAGGGVVCVCVCLLVYIRNVWIKSDACFCAFDDCGRW